MLYYSGFINRDIILERMLYYSGFINRVGEVHTGDTVMDYLDQVSDTFNKNKIQCLNISM